MTSLNYLSTFTISCHIRLPKNIKLPTPLAFDEMKWMDFGGQLLASVNCILFRLHHFLYYLTTLLQLHRLYRVEGDRDMIINVVDFSRRVNKMAKLEQSAPRTKIEQILRLVTPPCSVFILEKFYDSHCLVLCENRSSEKFILFYFIE
jgi:hypothetical protein